MIKLAGTMVLLMLSGTLTGCTDDRSESEQKPVSQPSGATVEPSYAAGDQCEPAGGITPFCGFKNPEDLALLPDGKAVLVSEMGEFMLDTPGALAVFDPATGQRLNLPIDWNAEGDRWGNAACAAPDPALFSPHGFDLMQRDDGRQQLLVVDHGGREAVEFFELTRAENGWSLQWRGCALPPDDPFINDVAGLQDGGFLVTHMWNKSIPFEEVAVLLQNGEKTGWVWEWHADSGFRVLPNSEEVMPNGIAVSKDNQKIFVNVYMGNRVIKLDRATGALEGSVAVRQPDNVTIDADGNLWVASHQHDAINQTCTEVTEGACLLPFEVVKVNPVTMERETVLSHDGAPMGYVTVALKVGDQLFMGSAHGDRIARLPLGD